MYCSPPLATLADMLTANQNVAFEWIFLPLRVNVSVVFSIPTKKLLSNRYPGHIATVICDSSQSRSDIVTHSWALDTFVQREACGGKPRPLGGDWTGQCKLCRVIGCYLRPWACLKAPICQWLAEASRGPPCYTTRVQQALCWALDRASAVSGGMLHFHRADALYSTRRGR